MYFGENRKDKDIEAIKRGLKRQMEVLKEEEIGPIVKHNYEVCDVIVPFVNPCIIFIYYFYLLFLFTIFIYLSSQPRPHSR